MHHSKSEARNLGVTFDSHPRLKTHVSNICGSGWAFNYVLGRIMKYLDNDSTERLVHAFITSRLHCCNSFLTGLPDRNFKDSRMLQPVLSLALDAGIISLLCYRAFIGYQSLTGSGTKFFSWSSKLSMTMFLLILIVPYAPIRPAALSGLPHKSLSGFHHSVHGQVSMAKREFATTGPTLWNSLPSEIRNAANDDQFKCKLKTFLFNDYYEWLFHMEHWFAQLNSGFCIH